MKEHYQITKSLCLLQRKIFFHVFNLFKSMIDQNMVVCSIRYVVQLHW